MTDRLRTNAPAAHARHDLSIVAALAARAADLTDAEAATARAQVASCAACEDALADFIALQTTLPTTVTPRRPRDFRLTPEDAQRLHRSGWRRFLGYFGSPRDGFSRPLAIGLTTLGVAGVLLASVPASMFQGGSGGAAPMTAAPAPVNQAAPAPGTEGNATDRTTPEAAGASSAAPSAAMAAPSASAASSAAASPTSAVLGNVARSPAASGSSDTQVFTGGNPDEVIPDTSGGSDTGLRDDTSGPSTLLLVGGALLIAGLGLFALRWSARRLS